MLKVFLVGTMVLGIAIEAVTMNPSVYQSNYQSRDLERKALAQRERADVTSALTSKSQLLPIKPPGIEGHGDGELFLVLDFLANELPEPFRVSFLEVKDELASFATLPIGQSRVEVFRRELFDKLKRASAPAKADAKQFWKTLLTEVSSLTLDKLSGF